MPEHARTRSLRVHVPNNEVLGIWAMGLTLHGLGKYMIIGYLLGIWAIVIIVHGLGKYMIIGYLDP